MSKQQFQLRLDMQIQPLDGQGRWTGERGLCITDEVKLGQVGFLEAAAVLSRFHELAGMIEQSKGLPPVPATPAGPVALGDLPDLRGHKIYINEAAQIGLTCYAAGCPTEGQMELPCKRVTVGDLLQAIAAHRRQHHMAPVVPS